MPNSTVTAPQAKVLIADDEVLLRDGLAALLARSGFDVVGAVGDAVELKLELRRTDCDLVIVDIRMPPTHTTEGLEAARWIREHFPHVRILVLSSHLEVEHAVQLLSHGCGIGYLLKQRITALSDFVSAVHDLLKGEPVIDPALSQELLRARHANDPLESLTPRERDVLEQMARGRSNIGIADELHLSEASIEKNVHRILNKLGLTNSNGTRHRRVLAVLTFLDHAVRTR